MASTRSKLDEIVASFATLEDPRSHINRRHPLPSILVIAVLAVLAGAAGPTATARWAKLKQYLLEGLLDLPRGIPGKDVFRRVLMTLKPEAFEAAFNAWIARLRDEAVAATGVDRPIVAMGAQKAIAEEVVRGKADYVLALKGNHETLHRAVLEHIDEQLEGDLE